ncbi:MAG TPA: hypothetical protein VHG35_18165 [Gemmatimonadales bacterium]|nr:hypothetical protein [Gemmatimonadales bacterium]
MSHTPARQATSPDALPTLADRVLERVRQAELAAGQSPTARTARPRRRVTDTRRTPEAVGRTPEQVREARSLRRVFLDMGDSYREFRRRTGAPIAPEVRDAADRFRRERSVDSLTGVAAKLDELRVLTW